MTITQGGCGTRHLTWLGALWSLPDTLIGLGFAMLSLCVPWPRDGLLIAESNRGLAYLFLTRRGFGAITFGRVVVSAIPITPHLHIRPIRTTVVAVAWGAFSGQQSTARRVDSAWL